MAQITYPDKQTAVNPASPAANEIFTATDANMIKSVVNGLDTTLAAQYGAVSLATTDFTSATLNTAYPGVIIGYEVSAPYLSGGPLVYKKVTSTVWYPYSIGMAKVAGTSDASGNFTVVTVVPDFPNIAVYEGANLVPASYNNTTKVISGLNPSAAFTAKFTS